MFPEKMHLHDTFMRKIIVSAIKREKIFFIPVNTGSISIEILSTENASRMRKAMLAKGTDDNTHQFQFPNN